MELRLAVRGGAVPTPLKDVFNLLFWTSALIWLGVAFIIIIVPAHLSGCLIAAEAARAIG